MADPQTDYLKPDYDKSLSEVFANATFHFITQASSLDPILGWQAVGRHEEVSLISCQTFQNFQQKCYHLILHE